MKPWLNPLFAGIGRGIESSQGFFSGPRGEGFAHPQYELFWFGTPQPPFVHDSGCPNRGGLAVLLPFALGPCAAFQWAMVSRSFYILIGHNVCFEEPVVRPLAAVKGRSRFEP